MLWHRIRGLWNSYHCILAVVLTVFFWTYLAVVSALLQRSDILLSGRFVLYNLAGIAGLAVAAIREGEAPRRFFPKDLCTPIRWRSNRPSTWQ